MAKAPTYSLEAHKPYKQAASQLEDLKTRLASVDESLATLRERHEAAKEEAETLAVDALLDPNAQAKSEAARAKLADIAGQVKAAEDARGIFVRAVARVEKAAEQALHEASNLVRAAAPEIQRLRFVRREPEMVEYAVLTPEAAESVVSELWRKGARLVAAKAGQMLNLSHLPVVRWFLPAAMVKDQSAERLSNEREILGVAKRCEGQTVYCRADRPFRETMHAVAHEAWHLFQFEVDKRRGDFFGVERDEEPNAEWFADQVLAEVNYDRLDDATINWLAGMPNEPSRTKPKTLRTAKAVGTPYYLSDKFLAWCAARAKEEMAVARRAQSDGAGLFGGGR